MELRIKRNLIKGEKFKMIDQMRGKDAMPQVTENGYTAARIYCINVPGRLLTYSKVQSPS